MTKIIKFTGRFLGYFSEWLLIFITVFFFIIKTSTFQTFLGIQIANYLSTELNAEVKISKVDIDFFESVILEGFMIKDQNGQVLVSAPSVKLLINDFSFFEDYLYCDFIELIDGEINVYREHDKDFFNYQFLIDYFSSDSKESSTFVFTSEAIILNDMSCSYRDEKDTISDDEFDYNHMEVTGLNMTIAEFKSLGDQLNLRIENLDFVEQNNNLKVELSLALEIGLNNYTLRDYKIQFNNSLIQGKLFQYDKNSTNGYRINSELDSSLIILNDFHSFSTKLSGIEDTLFLKGKFNLEQNNLSFNNFLVHFGPNYLAGNFSIENYSQLDSLYVNAKIDKSRLDFPSIRNVISNIDSTMTMDLAAVNEDFLVLEILDFNIQGNLDSVRFNVRKINSYGGSISIDPIIAQWNFDERNLIIKPVQSNWMQVNNLEIGKLISESSLGQVTSTISSGEIKIKDLQTFEVDDLLIKTEKLILNGHAMNDLSLYSKKINPKKSKIKITSNDKNLNVQLDANLENITSKNSSVHVNAKVQDFNPGKLGFIEDDQLNVGVQLVLDYKSMGKSSLSKLNINNLELSNRNKYFMLDSLVANYYKYSTNDSIVIKSDILDLNCNGNFDSKFLVNNLIEDLSVLLPLSIKKNKKNQRKDNLNLTIKSKNELNEMLRFFDLDLDIAEKTVFISTYSSLDHKLEIQTKSSNIRYGIVNLSNLNLKQEISKNTFSGNLDASKVKIDSVYFDEVKFKNSGQLKNISSSISWNIQGHDSSKLEWNMIPLTNQTYMFSINPSFFTVNNFRWEIPSTSTSIFNENTLSVENLTFKRDNQYITMNGCVSDNDFDELILSLKNINLEEISKILGLQYELQGTLNSSSHIKDAFGDINMKTNAEIQNLYISGEEIGLVEFNPRYNSKNERIDFNGKLNFKDSETFNFNGNYFLPLDSIAARLNFGNTDIKVANAFLDPEILKDVDGKLNGLVQVNGQLENPDIHGFLRLNNGSFHSTMTNMNYKVQAGIEIKKNTIELNDAKITDSENNAANLYASIDHQNYSDFNFDVMVDFEGYSTGTFSDYKFKILDTDYKDGEYYFGQAYATGSFNISGDDDLIRIELNAETKNGTEITFPLYGAEEFEENEDFIQYIIQHEDSILDDELDNYSGVDMIFHFNINENALMKLVFDETTGDQLEARGYGDISLEIDPMYNMNMLGAYNISEGSKYNFAMGSFKQPFDISSGSSINWNGDVTDAQLDVAANMRLKRVSLLELSPDQIDKSLASQDVICKITLKDNLMQPTIGFNIEAPKAPESGKALIRKVIEDQDELNKQFFSLLLVKKFQPLKGTITANGSAALDVLETQINDLLGKISGKYKLNVDYGRDDVINETSATFGLKTGFFNDRLLVSGTFGVDGIGSNSGQSNASELSSSIIGDVQIEYLINEKGTFRLNAFNESNTSSQNNINLDNNTGSYTQGVGISYNEEFHNWKDFMLLQYTLDIFRKEKKYIKRRKKKRKTISVND